MFVIARTTTVEQHRREWDRTTLIQGDRAEETLAFDTLAAARAYLAGIPVIGSRSYGDMLFSRPRYRVVNLDKAPAYIDDLLAFGGHYDRRRAGGR